MLDPTWLFIESLIDPLKNGEVKSQYQKSKERLDKVDKLIIEQYNKTLQ